MKIYVSQDNEKLGPYSKEELRDLIYSGRVRHSATACIEGSTEWLPIDNLLNQREASPTAGTPPPAPAPSPVPPPVASRTLSLEKLRDPLEQTTLVWLFIASIPAWLFLIVWTVVGVGVPLFIAGLILLSVLIGELWFAAYLRVNAVRVSPTQLPELYQVAQSCCHRLNMPMPEVYVMQENVWNAFAAKILSRRMVVLLSGAVDSILLKGNIQQLAWLLGHELGHHRAGHLDFGRKLANVGDWCVWLKLWHSRRRELTADRIGLYCAGSLQASQLALVNAAVGAQLASKVNVAEAIQQWRQHSGEFFVRYRTLYATHPHLLARLDHLNNAAAELGLGR
jgi:Zn-dependent protease with chaperone function